MIRLAASLATAVLASAPSAADTTLFVPDTWTEVDASVAGATSVVLDPGPGLATVRETFPLPAGARLAGIEMADDGAWYFVVDHTVEIGGITVRPTDVARRAGDAYSLVFDGSAAGLAAGARIDAVSIADGDIVLSFDIDTVVGGIAVSDEDLVRHVGTAFSVEVDFSAHGVPSALDVDAARRNAEGHWWVSFSAHGEVAGVTFSDEDVLSFDPVSDAWALAYRADRPELAPVDLSALTVLGDQVFAHGFESP